MSEGNFELFDLSGKLVQSGIFNNNKIVIDRISGTYILKVRSSGGKQAKLVTKLIIK
ncbi:MAG: T9SS type A sorting domain-containing protein [Chryseobacterium sp.]|nr:T9SS type A sorting domain-containing protein [Chryseobacterium sp.]